MQHRALQPFAVTKRVITDLRHTGRHHDGLQLFIAAKGSLGQCGHAGRHFYADQRHAAAECVIVDVVHALRQIDIFHAAAHKGPIADTGDAEGQADVAGQVLAAIESVVTDGLHAGVDYQRFDLFAQLFPRGVGLAGGRQLPVLAADIEYFVVRHAPCAADGHYAAAVQRPVDAAACHAAAAAGHGGGKGLYRYKKRRHQQRQQQAHDSFFHSCFPLHSGINTQKGENSPISL